MIRPLSTSLWLNCPLWPTGLLPVLTEWAVSSSFFLFCLVSVPLFFFPIFPSGQGLLSQSALQLNNQESYAAAGYHNNQGLESVTGRSGQVGGAVHIYNQVNACGTNCMTSFPCDFEGFCHVSETVSHFIELLKEVAVFAWALCRKLCPEICSDSRLSWHNRKHEWMSLSMHL